MQPEEIRAIFENAADFEERTVIAGGQALAVFFIDGLTSGSEIADFVIRPLRRSVREGSMADVLEQARTGAVCCASVSGAKTAEDAAKKLVNGFCVVV